MSETAPKPRSVGVQHRTVSAEAGQRVDNFLLRILPGVPRARVYQMLRRGEVRVNGGRVKPTHRLASADVVRVPPVVLPEAGVVPTASASLVETLQQRIIYRDDDILGVDKPSGLAVHGGSGVRLGVIEALRQIYPDERLELAHRLDRDTSGCLVLARNRSALLRLHDAFRTGRVKKTYDVLVTGRWPRRARSVRQPLKRYTTASGERRVRVDPAGKTARTEFQVREVHDSVSWLTAHPHTGRTHQIRVHCLVEGHPVLGDEKYASDAQLEAARAAGVTRLCLHARRLSFPWTDGHLRLEVEADAVFNACWAAMTGAHQAP